MKKESGTQELKQPVETVCLQQTYELSLEKVSMTIPKFPTDFQQNNIQHDQPVSKPEQRNDSIDDVNGVNNIVFNGISSQECVHEKLSIIKYGIPEKNMGTRVCSY